MTIEFFHRSDMGMPQRSDRPYDAFVSYSHADRTLAKALQSGLQRFARPWNRLRALAVFRDDSELAASPDLWESVRQAMDDSRYLIVVASPQARASEWVDREVRYWLRTRSLETVLVVVAAGEWRLGDTGASGESSAVIPALAEAYSAEPRHLDVRHLDEPQWVLSSADFRNAIAELAAPLHGKPKSELDSEDKRLFQRSRRLRRSALAALCLLATIAVIAGAVATVNANDANTSRQATRREQHRAQEARAAADRATSEAQAQERRAAAAAREADRQKALAAAFRGRADTARAEATRQLRIAQAQEALARTAAAEATRQQTLAAAAKGEAQNQAALATSRRLAEQSLSLQESDPATARRVAAAAWKVAPTVESRGALIRAWHNPEMRVARGPDGLAGFVDRHRVLSVDETGLRFWDTRTGRWSPSTTQGSGWVSDAAVTPDGRFAVVAHDWEYASVWDTRTLTRVRRVKESSLAHTVVVEPQGRQFGLFGHDDVSWWETRTGRRLSRVTMSTIERVAGDSLSVDVTAQGRLFAVDKRGRVFTWNLLTGKQQRSDLRLAGFEKELTVSPDSRLAAGYGHNEDGYAGIQVWDLRTGARIGVPVDPPDDDFGFVVRFAPDGRTITFANAQGDLRRVDFRTGITIGPAFRRTRGPIYDVEYSPDGRRMVTVAEGEHRLWNLGAPERVEAPGDDADMPSAVRFAAGGQRLLVGGQGGEVRMHALPSGSLLSRHPARHSWLVARSIFEATIASDRAGRVAVVGGDGIQVFRPAASSKETGHLGPPRFPVGPLAVSPGGSTAFVSRFISGDVLVFDVEHKKQIARFSTGRGIADLAVSPDGRTLAVAGPAGVSFWDTRSYRHLHRDIRNAGYGKLAYSPDGKQLVVSRGDLYDSGARVSVYRAADGHRLGDLAVTTTRVHDIAFSDDGNTIATANDEGGLELWDANSRQRIVSIDDDTRGAAHAIDFSRELGVLGMAYQDGSVALWKTDPSRIAADICRTYAGPLTRAEWKAHVPGQPYINICD
jgi:WD40 repeat protein